jgi:uncharacterized damage-inducible protein DinB
LPAHDFKGRHICGVPFLFYILEQKLRTMVIDSLKKLFDRDLDRLKNELSSYKKEPSLWEVKKYIKNSAGNLTLHIIGNLNYYIGAILGGNGYVRVREDEFSKKNIPVSNLLQDIDKVKTTIYNTLEGVSEAELLENFPVNVFGYEMSKLFFLMHLHSHLTYHLGQINYHRRLIEK